MASRQGVWSGTADNLKRNLARARWITLCLSVLGALPAAVASQITLEVPRFYIAVAGAILLAVASFLTSHPMGSERTLPQRHSSVSAGLILDNSRMPLRRAALFSAKFPQRSDQFVSRKIELLLIRILASHGGQLLSRQFNVSTRRARADRRKTSHVIQFTHVSRISRETLSLSGPMVLGSVCGSPCVLRNSEKIIGTGRKTSLVLKAVAIDAFDSQRTQSPSRTVSKKVQRCSVIATHATWSARGKYVADRKFEDNEMDQQIGTTAGLKTPQQLEPTIGVVAGPAMPSQETAPAPTAHAPVASDLAHLVVAALERKGYQVDRGPGELNIVYVEGMNLDGTPNKDEANKWNDLRLLIEFEGGQPKIVGKWAATTEPGRYWTENPLSPLGVARIAFGQYASWQVGMHHADKPSGHEALVQTGGPVTICRDLNKDCLRAGDKVQTGHFGINQHWGYDLHEVDKASAGCLVGQSKHGHREFMALVKSDPRYKANHKHVFATAILPESDVLAVRLGGASATDRSDARSTSRAI